MLIKSNAFARRQLFTMASISDILRAQKARLALKVTVRNNIMMVKVKEKIDELGLDTTSPQIQIIGRNKALELGTDKAKQISIDKYKCYWNGLRDFCLALGEYDSAIIMCRDICPSDPPPVKLDVAIHYGRYKVQEPGTPLLHYETNAPVKDKDGNPLYCVGEWTGRSTVKDYGSALNKLHDHYESGRGDYIQECKECCLIPLARLKKGEGCRKHLGAPRVWRTGCPSKHVSFRNDNSSLIQYVLAHYSAKTTFAFNPGMLRDLRIYLLSSNNMYNMMVWTILLVCIKGFLRIEEALQLTMENLKEQYFVVKEDTIEGLAMEVQGKCDEEPITMAMWDDSECPDFSPSRVLMIWIALTGIKGGNLFPCKMQLAEQCVMPTMHLDYDDYLEELKFLCAQVLKIDMESEAMKKQIIGTHTGRKTAYLFAFWGVQCAYKRKELTKVEEANILQSARHKDVSSAAKYLSDSATIYELLNKLDPDDPRHHVGVWKAIHIKTHVSWESINHPSKKFIKPPAQLADWYVFEKLGITRDSNFGGWSLLAIHEAACAYKPKMLCTVELQELLSKNLPSDILNTAMSMISKAANERVMQAVAHITEIAASATGDTGRALEILPPATPSPTEANRNKRKHSGDALVVFSKDYQQDIKKAHTSKAVQIQLCQQLVGELREQTDSGKTLDGGMCRFCYRAGAVVACVNACYSGSIDAFLQANKGFTISRFACSNGISHSGAGLGGEKGSNH
jgi:hypothetical protein